MVYVGVDLHRKRSQAAVVNEAGEVLANRAVATEGMEIMRVFGEVAPRPTPISVAFEATFGWGWFADLLQDAGVEAHMSHPLADQGDRQRARQERRRGRPHPGASAADGTAA